MHSRFVHAAAPVALFCRASYQQQYEAAVSALQAQQASNLADVTSLNRYLQDMGLPAQPHGSRPGTPQQQQQQQRAGPMQELVSRLQGVRAALEARAAAQRAAQQQLEAQVGGSAWCSCGGFSSREAFSQQIAGLLDSAGLVCMCQDYVTSSLGSTVCSPTSSGDGTCQAVGSTNITACCADAVSSTHPNKQWL